MRHSEEFSLVATCCGWPHDETHLDAVRALAGTGIEWARVVAIAQRHRVEGLVSQGLLRSGTSLPDPIRADMVAAGRRAAVQGMQQAAASCDLTRRIADAGARAVIVKGAPLAMLAYGSLSIKTSHDIDILVARRDVRAAWQAVETAGYRRYNPPIDQIDDDQLDRWFDHAIEGSWQHPDSGTIVEIHSRLCSHPVFDAAVSVRSPTQQVALGTVGQVETLSDESLYTYLCVHGATHGWRRLKWLADIAAFAARPEVDPAMLHAAAGRAGAGRCSAQASALAREMLGVPGWVPYREQRAPVVRLLASAARAAMIGKDETTDDMGPWGEPAGVILSRFWLGRGLGFKWAELRLRLRHPTDRARQAATSERGYLAIALRRLAGRLRRAFG
ncbi:nucleotidyltransferase family protein [Sphingomonas sp.]|uniref:nucleotidyltransferase family protein n=1 Tax=Sphingomonas sp. TaxID=28214 RepID=UPI002DD69DE4|nr:nucleotidyltransferase family protein [Sphingomonas sp.]